MTQSENNEKGVLTWLERAMLRCIAMSQNTPGLARFSVTTQLGIIVGTGLLGIASLLLGSILGGINRGAIGAIVGALSATTVGILVGAPVGGILGRILLPNTDDLEIEIETERPDRLYVAGDTVRGYVAIRSHKNIKLLGGTTCLWGNQVYTYEPSSTSDQASQNMVREPHELHLAHTRSIPERHLRRNVLLRYPFEYTLPPDAAPTYHGQMLSTRWEILAQAEQSFLPPILARTQIYVTTPAPTITRTVSQYRSLISTEPCQLLLSLPKVERMPGEPLNANLRLAARRPFAVSSIQAVLLRIESIPYGTPQTVYVSDWDPSTGQFKGQRWPGAHGNTYIWLEDEALLDQELAIDDGEMLSYDLELRIPERICPTLRGTPSVTWKLGVVVEQPSEQSARVFHEILVKTCSGWLGDIRQPASEPETRIRRVSKR